MWMWLPLNCIFFLVDTAVTTITGAHYNSNNYNILLLQTNDKIVFFSNTFCMTIFLT